MNKRHFPNQTGQSFWNAEKKKRDNHFGTEGVAVSPHDLKIPKYIFFQHNNSILQLFEIFQNYESWGPLKEANLYSAVGKFHPVLQFVN